MLGLTGVFAATGVVSALPESALQPTSAGWNLFNVRTYGATGEGRGLDTEAINRAVDACHAAGGGVVYVPPGVYLVGTVVLKSNVTLYLEAGATLLGSKNIADYTPQVGPDAEADAGQKHLIFARDAENVGLAGRGVIDGQGPAFWVPSGRPVLPPSEAWRDVEAHAWKPLRRASPLLEFCRCRNLHIDYIRIQNASGWTLRPIECDNVFIRGISIKNPVYGSNTDGIDPTGCHNVFISDCTIDTGDDAICLKSESPYGGEPRVSKNITITNCVLTTCCNGLKFGTATHGGFENVAFTNSVIYNEAVNLKARVISGVAIEMVDGGWVEGVTISNIRMQRTRTPIFIRRGNRTPRADGTPGTLRGIMIDNLHATGAVLASSITGLPGFPVEDVTLSNIRIDSDDPGKSEWVGRAIPEVAPNYPEARMFGRLPASGLYCRHAAGVRLHQVEFRAPKGEQRPTIVCDDVSDFGADGLRSTPIDGSQPVVKLVQCRDVLLRGCVAPKAAAFVGIDGDRTERVVLMTSELGGAEKPAVVGNDVSAGALTLAGNVGRA